MVMNSSFVKLDTLVIAFDPVFFGCVLSGQWVELHQTLRQGGLETTRDVRDCGLADLVVSVVQDEMSENMGGDLI